VALVVLCEHRRHEGVDAVDDAPDVHAECPLPVAELVLPDRTLCARADAGVVAQDVNRAVRGERRIPELLHRLLRRDVGLDTGHVETVSP